MQFITLENFRHDHEKYLDKIRRGTFFCRTTKTGGSTVHQLLEPALEDTSYAYQRQDCDRRFPGHVEENFRNYFSFFQVRHPYIRFLSGLEMFKRGKRGGIVERLLENVSLLELLEAPDSETFSARYPLQAEDGKDFSRGLYRHTLQPQWDCFLNTGGTPDLVYETHQINEFLDLYGRILTSLGVPQNISAENAKGRKVSGNPIEYYIEEIKKVPGLQQALYHRFRDDFEHFGSVFDWSLNPELICVSQFFGGRRFRIPLIDRPESRPREEYRLWLNQDTELVHLDSGFHLQDGDSGKLHDVNESAAWIWQCCAQGHSNRDIEDLLSRQLPGCRHASGDIDDTLEGFVRLGLADFETGPVKVRGITFRLDYEADAGMRSERSERLVRYCMGKYADSPIPEFVPDLGYSFPSHPVLACLCRNRDLTLWRREQPTDIEAGKVKDHKRIVEAWISQRASIPDGLSCWLVRGIRAGDDTDPSRGAHVGVVRKPRHSHVILVPGSNRQQYLGRNLALMATALRDVWTPWSKKRDVAWWGGDPTGDCADDRSVLSRYRFLKYVHRNPSDRIVTHVVSHDCSGIRKWPRAQWEGQIPDPKGKFEKQDAFAHRCIVLLPGHDQPSALSWAFCGNSVILMQPPQYENMLTFELEPWVHYVPLEPDPADILVKLDWVLENQDEAREIVARALERIRWFSGSEYQWACNEVLRRLVAGRHTPPREFRDTN